MNILDHIYAWNIVPASHKQALYILLTINLITNWRSFKLFIWQILLIWKRNPPKVWYFTLFLDWERSLASSNTHYFGTPLPNMVVMDCIQAKIRKVFHTIDLSIIFLFISSIKILDIQGIKQMQMDLLGFLSTVKCHIA